MNDFTLARTYLPDGTTSVINIGIELFGVERSQDDPLHPCLPAARYELEPHHGPKSADGPIWALVNHEVNVYHEPPAGATQDKDGIWHLEDGTAIRVACLFGHVANEPKDVEGCVGLGKERPDIARAWVSESHVAVREFQRQMAMVWQPGVGLVITEAPAVPA